MPLMNLDDIKNIIPHREPFILIDTVHEMELGKSCRASLTLTGKEEFFKGHFPEYKVMPGVLILEAMAQTGAVCILGMDEYKGKIALFAGADNVKFKHQVLPGDTIDMQVELERIKMGMGVAKGTAHVNGKLAASAVIKFAVAK